MANKGDQKLKNKYKAYIKEMVNRLKGNYKDDTIFAYPSIEDDPEHGMREIRIDSTD